MAHANLSLGVSTSSSKIVTCLCKEIPGVSQHRQWRLPVLVPISSSTFNLFIYQLNQCLSSIYYMPDTILNIHSRYTVSSWSIQYIKCLDKSIQLQLVAYTSIEKDNMLWKGIMVTYFKLNIQWRPHWEISQTWTRVGKIVPGNASTEKHAWRCWGSIVFRVWKKWGSERQKCV